MNAVVTPDSSLARVRSDVLDAAGIADRDLERALGTLMRGAVDNADLYFQVSRQESWTLEDGIVKEGAHSIEQGVGVRAMSGEKTGFAYSDEVMVPALLQASAAASAIVRQGQQGRVQAWQPRAGHRLYAPIDPLPTLRDDDKVALLQRIDSDVRALDPRVKQVVASLAAAHDVVLVCASDGTLAADVRPLVRFNISVIVEDGDKREQGYAGGGGRFGYEHFTPERVLDFGREAVRQAIVNLGAVPAPSGEMIVVHEAIGHGLEGDFNRKGTSAFTGRIGERVASDLCTVVDDGTLPGRRGSLNVDDEGTPTRNTVLIENGILRGYLQDKMNARLMGVESTGNGRRQSFAHTPMPRMTNTYMLAGAHHPDEIIASVKKGVYARNFGGGQVDITSGKFVFSATEAYRIENGRLGAPIRDATLVGDGPTVLNRVTMVGNDMALDTGIGVCGKEGQSVPVGVGQPTLRIDGLTVGGTASDMDGNE